MSSSFLAKLYPRAFESRTWHADAALRKIRIQLLKALGKNFVLLQLLFFAFVDYDGGSIGRAVRVAYGQLEGNAFPTLIEHPMSDFATREDLRTAVCDTRYWAALAILPGSSDRLRSALANGSNATAYDKSSVMLYIWNEARYSAVVDSLIAANLQTLSSAARVAYTAINGTGELQSVTSPNAIAILANPWELTNINIQPTTQGSRAIYNTLVIILIIIQEFFYLGTINGLYDQLQIFKRADPQRIVMFRNINTLVFTMLGSLGTVGAIWAFRSGWNVNGNQFVLSWMTLWLFAHLNFNAMDVFTVWLPAPFVPMALISWIILNITSILLPFQLSPGFYRVGYVMPAHEVYQVLTDVWSGGCNPQLRYALPVLFAWEFGALCLSTLGVFRRCHFATLAAEMQARQLQERIDAALEFERGQEMKERKAEKSRHNQATSSDNQPSSMPDESEVERELRNVISDTDRRVRREAKLARNTGHYGPHFTPYFAATNDSDD